MLFALAPVAVVMLDRPADESVARQAALAVLVVGYVLLVLAVSTGVLK